MKAIFGNLIINYLRFWARLRLNSVKPKIIGITGSVGKSSCTYLLAGVLSPHFRTKTTYHGNSETGLPLELLDLRDQLSDFSSLSWIRVMLLAPLQALFNRPDWELIIAEMGIDSPYEPKNMSYLLKIIQPQIGIFLNVAAVHTEQFKPVVDPKSRNLESALVEAIAKEKGLIVTRLKPSDQAIINTDYPQIKALIPQIKAQITSIGLEQSADYHLVSHHLDQDGTKFICQTPDGKIEIKLSHYLLLEEFAPTLLAVFAAARSLGVSADQITQTLAKGVELPPGRQTLLVGLHGSRIIDSSYNSSPAALEAHLNLIKQLPAKGQKIVILGDMNELGDIAQTEHERLAKIAAGIADVVVLVGDQMAKYGLPAILETNFSKSQLYAYKTAAGVGQFIADNKLKKDDLILVKGSQNKIYLEQVVAELVGKSNRLCRQSDYWDKKRQQFFQAVPNQQLFPA